MIEKTKREWKIPLSELDKFLGVERGLAARLDAEHEKLHRTGIGTVYIHFDERGTPLTAFGEGKRPLPEGYRKIVLERIAKMKLRGGI